ncbi:MAG: hypothetical protein K9M56_04215 [Victivallales bacterium]|nr:hypothetical protein [Victivallales bacterium]
MKYLFVSICIIVLAACTSPAQKELNELNARGGVFDEATAEIKNNNQLSPAEKELRLDEIKVYRNEIEREISGN